VVSGTFKGHEQKALQQQLLSLVSTQESWKETFSVPVRRTKLFPAHVALRAKHMRVSPFAVPPVTCENYQSAGPRALTFNPLCTTNPKIISGALLCASGASVAGFAFPGPHAMQYRE